MGRSNGCEANRKRADAQKRAEKYAKEGKSQIAANQAALTLKCEMCMQTFMGTQKKAALLHYESKHSKLPWEQCFPALDKSECS